ncbi:MAG TPA: hypothetical protein VNO18_11975 [Xanthobacteraceae bacterium]|nr:hypothetical protein [Xanthobacteraceae bacterium]
MVFVSAPAPAQDFTAGKTPAQLFSSDCAECHRTPNGLARNRDVRTLAGFLREHYTTKSETAGALAAYVSGFTGSGAAVVRNRGAGVAAPANIAAERPPADRRSRSDSEATATGEDARTDVRPIQDPAGRRRRATNLSGDGEKRRDSEATATGEDARTDVRPIQDPAGRRRRATNPSGDGEKRRVRKDGDVPRPPVGIVPTPAPVKLNAPAGDSAPHDADPVSRLRSYLSSGLGSEGTIAEAAKTGSQRARKHRNRSDDAEPSTPDVQTSAKTATDPTATDPTATDPPPTAFPSGTIDAIAAGTPPEGNASPATAPSTPPPVTPPRLEQ